MAAAALIAASVALGPLARAQSPGAVACTGQRISAIDVVTDPPFDTLSDKWYAAPARYGNALHSTTDAEVVRRFLLVHEGEPCTERDLTESERILRDQPFLADASVSAYPDGAGGVRILARTRDEFTPVVGMRTNAARPYVRSLRVGDGNLFGTGRFAAVEWVNGVRRNGAGVRYVDNQFLRQPYILDLEGRRGDLGDEYWLVDASHPFLTDLQRISWRVRAQNVVAPFEFLRNDAQPAALQLERQFFDVGGVVRIGVPGRLSLFGISFSKEIDRTTPPPVRDSTVDYGTLLAGFENRSNARVNALWGVRNIYYRRVERFDALDAAQDIQLGFQLGTIFGRSLSVLGTTDDDILVGSDAYIGVGGSETFAWMSMRGEGRQNYHQNDWDGIILSTELHGYRRLTPRHTGLLTASFGGAWRQRVPFQLTLRNLEGGLIGFRSSTAQGAHRLVLHVEDRAFLGVLRSQAAVGLSLFGEAGRLWAGDVPFGVTTPFRYSVGVGLLAAVPPRSKRTWRVDIGYPVTRTPGSGIEIRFSTINAARAFSTVREPSDLSYSREQVVPSSVFQWP